MSFEREPPRFRSLSHALPAELRRALEYSPAEEATREQLEAVRASIRRRFPGSRQPPARKHWLGPSKKLPLVAIGLTFALGAAAGVAASGGLGLIGLPDRSRASGDEAKAPRASKLSKRGATASPAASSRENAAPSVLSVPGGRPQPAEPNRAAARSFARAPQIVSAEVARAADDELSLLARAQRALSRDPQAALALVAQHAKEFPNGDLSQEREVIAIEALSRMGRRQEAEARAERFHRRFPSSAHRRRVEVLLGVRRPEPVQPR